MVRWMMTRRPTAVWLVAATIAMCMAAASVAAREQWANTVDTTRLWRMVHDGDTDGLMRMALQSGNARLLKVRSEDGRGAAFWAYEYKKADVVALCRHFGIGGDGDMDAGDNRPQDLFEGSDAQLSEFEKRVEREQATIGARLDRLREQLASDAEDDEDDEDEEDDEYDDDDDDEEEEEEDDEDDDDEHDEL